MKRVLLALLSLVVLVSACGSSLKSVDLTPVSSSETLKKVPDWFITVPQDPNHIYAAATATSRTSSTTSPTTGRHTGPRARRRSRRRT